MLSDNHPDSKTTMEEDPQLNGRLSDHNQI